MTAAFDEIERGDGSVSRAAGCEGGVSSDSDEVIVWVIASTNDAAESACCEVVPTEKLNLLLGLREGSHGVCVVRW